MLLETVGSRWRLVQMFGSPNWTHYIVTAESRLEKLISSTCEERQLPFISGLKPGARVNLSDVELLAAAFQDIPCQPEL
jgi:hypothetical protein